MIDAAESNLLQEFLKSESYSELKMRQVIFNVDPNVLFEGQCRKDLGIQGLRMDLFF